MPGPKISVLMAVCNGAPFIAEALQSVLQQAGKGLEIIVIDDGSTDGTSEIVTAIANKALVPIRCAYQANQGQAKALNHALSLAAGEIIAFIDADDLWVRDRLQFQCRLLGQADLVLGKVKAFADGAHVNPLELKRFNDRPYHYNLGSSLIRRRAIEKVGPFNEAMRMVCDWDWFARARDLSVSMAICHRICLLQRIHFRNITRQRELGSQNTLLMLRRQLERRRAAASAATPPVRHD